MKMKRSYIDQAFLAIVGVGLFVDAYLAIVVGTPPMLIRDMVLAALGAAYMKTRAE